MRWRRWEGDVEQTENSFGGMTISLRAACSNAILPAAVRVGMSSVQLFLNLPLPVGHGPTEAARPAALHPNFSLPFSPQHPYHRTRFSRSCPAFSTAATARLSACSRLSIRSAHSPLLIPLPLSAGLVLQEAARPAALHPHAGGPAQAAAHAGLSHRVWRRAAGEEC